MCKGSEKERENGGGGRSQSFGKFLEGTVSWKPRKSLKKGRIVRNTCHRIIK